MASAHLQFPPQATFAAAHTVHDPGDVLKMEAELLLNRRNRNPQLDLLKVPTTQTERLELTFSVLASILCPANMDFSSKCIGNPLKDRRRGQIESLE